MREKGRNPRSFQGALQLTFSLFFLLFFFILPDPGLYAQSVGSTLPANGAYSGLSLQKVIKGNIRPKSVIYAGNGRFFAQNMMYRHSVTVYDRDFRLIETISDAVRLTGLGNTGKEEIYQGSPVEAALSPDGQSVWVSNYQMYGPGFDNPGNDACGSGTYDNSLLYRIDTEELSVQEVVEVGSVPKYLTISPDGRWLLVSNWCGSDLSVVDLDEHKEIRRIPVGKYPRGIAVDPASQFAYVAIMSTDKILAIRLDDFSVAWGIHIAGSPRHLCISPDGKFMYASLNSLGKVAKIDLVERKLLKSVPTGRTPRSMALSPDGNYLYVVNYLANTLSRIRTSDMEVMESVETRKGPIGIAVDPETWNVWVACYTGSLEIYSDKAAYLESRIHADRETALHQSPEQLHPLQDSLTNLPFFAFEPAVEWEMEAKPEAIAIPDNVSSKSEARTYRLILGSFSEPVNARSFSAKLAKADLQTDLLPNGKGGYRVAYGEYASKAEAKVALELLRQNHNLESWILSP